MIHRFFTMMLYLITTVLYPAPKKVAVSDAEYLERFYRPHLACMATARVQMAPIIIESPTAAATVAAAKQNSANTTTRSTVTGPIEPPITVISTAAAQCLHHAPRTPQTIPEGTGSLPHVLNTNSPTQISFTTQFSDDLTQLDQPRPASQHAALSTGAATATAIEPVQPAIAVDPANATS